MQYASGQRGRALSVIDFDLAVDDYEIDADRILIWLFKGRAIDHRLRIEDRNVCKVAFANQSSLFQTHIRRRQAGHLVNREFQRH